MRLAISPTVTPALRPGWRRGEPFQNPECRSAL